MFSYLRMSAINILIAPLRGDIAQDPLSAAFVITAEGSNKVCHVIFVIKLNNETTIKLK